MMFAYKQMSLLEETSTGAGYIFFLKKKKGS